MCSRLLGEKQRENKLSGRVLRNLLCADCTCCPGWGQPHNPVLDKLHCGILQKLSCFGIRMANDTKRVDLYLGTPLQSIYVLSVWPARG